MTFNGTILLVDDELHIRKFVTLLLKQIGSPKILEASNGEEALALYASEKPDLVLLDISMPVLSGLDTLKQLRAADPEAIVIMLTSLTNRQSVEGALALGAVNYIRKDLPKEEIIQALNETIEGVFESENP